MQKASNKRSPDQRCGTVIKIRTFYAKSIDTLQRDLIWRTVDVDLSKFICTTPAHYDYGYGTMSQGKFEAVIPMDSWVLVHFMGDLQFNMLAGDYEESFGRRAPKTLEGDM